MGAVRLGHTKVAQVETAFLFVQQTHDHTLVAIGGGQGRHADIHRLAAETHRHTAILRFAGFGDIQARLDLDTADERRCNDRRRLVNFLHDAINTKANQQLFFEWLDVDVGCFTADRLREDGVEQTDDRRFVGRLHQIFGLRHALVDDVHHAAQLIVHRAQTAFGVLIVLGDKGAETLVVQQLYSRRAAGAAACFEQCPHRCVGTVCERQNTGFVGVERHAIFTRVLVGQGDVRLICGFVYRLFAKCLLFGHRFTAP